jgi:hypothetical protein
MTKALDLLELAVSACRLRGQLGMSKCPDCDKATIASNLRFCPVCAVDWGFPNVREVESTEEQHALNKRFFDASKRAGNNGCAKQIKKLAHKVEHDSHVVMAMRPLAARQFIQNPSELYQNYWKLVGTGLRKPSKPVDDIRRRVVDSLLFGCFADEIRFGVLSLDGQGLPSYGSVFLRLHDEAIMSRTSFLECNSWDFVAKFNLGSQSTIPKGYRGTWKSRHKLAVAKLEPLLKPAHGEPDLVRLMVFSDAQNRANDDFIEAHVYGHFSAEAINSIEFIEAKFLSREEKSDVKILKRFFGALHKAT